jgi:poly(3-hydroxybutyrate) depolymerase
MSHCRLFGQRLGRAAMAVALAAAGALASPALAEPLPRLAIEGPAGVAGLSSGGAMAVQLHVAHSKTFGAGSAVIAGVPYDCAQGSVLRATTLCMRALPVSPDERTSIRITEAQARDGRIDPTGSLASSRVYLASGTRDQVVRRPVMDALHRYYRQYVPAGNILYDTELQAGHAWVSPAGSQACSVTESPYVVDCGIDVPGRMLAWLFGATAPKPEQREGVGQKAAPTGRLLTFDQRRHLTGLGDSLHSMDDSGWVFVPRRCADGERCRLLVVLHGCMQGRDAVGDGFVRKTGLDKWADANGIVVLYPQVRATAASNPRGCWDWWGYSGAGYATREGVQVRAIMAMVEALGAAKR